MTRGNLQEKVDYFYCDVCKIHVPCVRIEPGVWEVRCPQCVGECAVCGCHLANYCFGQGSGPVQMKLRVVRLEHRS